MKGKKRHRRVNPNRQPLTVAEMRRSMNGASNSFLMLSLYALLDAGADVEFIERFAQKFDGVASLLLKDKISVKMIESVIETEYTQELAALEEANCKAFFMGEDGDNAT